MGLRTEPEVTVEKNFCLIDKEPGHKLSRSAIWYEDMSSHAEEWWKSGEGCDWSDANNVWEFSEEKVTYSGDGSLVMYVFDSDGNPVPVVDKEDTDTSV